MAFEKNNFLVARKKSLEKREFTVECNVSTGANVNKILTLAVEGEVSNSEVLNGVINFSGSVDTKLVFLCDDEQISSVNANCPFSSKFESEDIETGQIAEVKVKVVDYNIDSVGGDMVKISVRLEQSGFIVGNQEIGTISCNDDCVCIKNEEIDVIKFIGAGSENITIESEINVRENIKKILLTESSVIVKSVDSGVNFVSVTGDVVSRVLYLNENDRFESGYVYDGFKEEIELAGATRDSRVEAEAKVNREGVMTELVQDEKGCKLLVKMPVSISVRAYDNERISVINDLYSTKGEVTATTSSYNMTEVCPLELVEGKIEGSLTLDENSPRVDKVLFNGGNSVTITNSYVKDGEVFVEGIAKTTVVYLNDETSSLQSVVLDVPFALNDKINCEEGALTVVDAIVCDVDVVVKKGREFYYDAKVKASVNCCHDLVSGVISEASLQEEDRQKDYAMEIIFAPRGKDLWDIAKSARVKEEQILSQNPEVEFPCQEDTPLVLFEQRLQ